MASHSQVCGRPTEPGWVEVRDRLNGSRHGLARAAAGLYPDMARAGSTRLLVRAGWIPATPLDLREVRLGWVEDAPAPAVTGREPEAAALLPEGARTYADALRSLARPRLFEDRACYRLLEVAWPELTFTRARYFDGVSVGEAAAHEFAAHGFAAHGFAAHESAAWDSAACAFVADESVAHGFPARRPAAHEPAGHRGRPPLPFRALVGDPTDLRRRSALCAVSTLTLRHDRRTGNASFVLHWRDAARVAHGGGLFQVMPVGVFQPAREAADAEKADLDLWKCLVREYAEPPATDVSSRSGSSGAATCRAASTRRTR
ncbi:MAG: hypothetical protein IRZ07_12955 [Microbispora sp.]|nr:hypothetical protein [Microbispora sp.]